MRLFLLSILTLFVLSSRASHIVGGDIYYDYLGANQYRFYVSIYRDCLSTGAQFDSPLWLAVYDQNNTMVQNVSIPFPGDTDVPVVFNNPCVTPPSNICTENAIYITTLTLPPIPGGYRVSYQRCCRGPNITNIINPDDTGFTLTCIVPGPPNNNYINSSPRFNNYPPLLLCNNEDLIFDHSATDPDGDQLVYSLVTPFSGASSFNPAPNPTPPPPYANVQWVGGFTAANPLGPGATINIDPNTGLLTASPNLTGLFAVGIQVEEIRNGVVINRTMRDFLFRVFNCQLQLEAVLPLQTDLPDFISYCDGLTINFVNNSYGGTNYEWNFGDPTTSNDVSSAFAPSYTYPDNGQYQAMLVVNPGWPCTDTAYMDIIVNNEIEVSFTSNDSLCVLDNSFDFVGSTTGPPSTQITWDFGPDANTQTGTGLTINGITYNQPGTFPVTVEASFNSCVASFTESVYVFPEPTAEIVLPGDIACEGLTIDFGNNTINATNYSWSFGDNSADSPDFEPTHTYPGPGTYTVSLSAWSSPACINTTQETFTLNEELTVTFTSEDSLCFTNNSFNFDGTVTGPPTSVYTWNFGPHASIQTSNEVDVFDVSFNTTGSIPITLSGSFDDCQASVTHDIYIFQEPSVDFRLEPGLQCVPFTANFVDLSFAETNIYYFWDFGDGNTSTEQNPVNVYTETGPYPVTLTIRTDRGCIDTLTAVKQDLVHVRPIPKAGFSIDPDYTDICNSAITFTDESIGASEYFYWFDDSTIYTFEQNPVHLYYRDGTRRPMQIVKNEWQCRDTAYQELYIEPFTLYAPNSFTPDEDEFNNTFQPVVGLEVFEWKLQIYNQWGELVFESNDIDVGWDGTTPNGRMSQSGSYIWKLTYVTCEPFNPRRVKTGHVSLLR